MPIMPGFLTSSNMLTPMPKFPKSFLPFREKLKIRTNFRKLMRKVMLNNFKIMLFPKKRRVSQGILSSFKGLVFKNRGRRRAQHRNITNKTLSREGRPSFPHTALAGLFAPST